ncbi:MAG: redoxin domain-containing protein [Bacteroidales bacterium]|nr:redoxin domain-containing protein [Bacteroidales bacterium]
MRNLLIVVTLVIAGLTSCGPKNQYKIIGSITGIDSGLVYLQKRDGGEWKIIDSAELVSGKFNIKGAIESPELWYLTVKDAKVYVPLFVENSTITVDILADSLEGTSIKGSLSQGVYEDYLKKMEPISEEMNAIYMEYKSAREAGDEVAMAAADSMYEAVEARQKEEILAFAMENNTSVVAPYLIYRNAYMFDLPAMEEAALAMDTALNASTYMKDLTKQIAILKAVEIGQPAPDFTQADTAGNPLTLSSLKGNVLLIDFWASWCGPCRAENPNVVVAWQKYHNKGFDILGVSLDKSRDKWLEAIQADNLTWNQVSDLQYWNNEASNLYGVRSIPSNVLLDKDGIIIARNLRGEDLTNKLEEIFGPAK